MKPIALAATLAALLSLTACHAVKGLAKDTHDIAQHTQKLLEGKSKTGEPSSNAQTHSVHIRS